MKKAFALIIILCGLFSPIKECICQDIPINSILDSMVNNLKNKNHFAYRAKHQQKYFDREDTISTDWHSIKIESMPSDSILPYYFEMYHPNETRIYNGENLRLIWPSEKLVQVFPVTTTAKNLFINNIRRELVPGFLYQVDPFNSYLSKGNITHSSKIKLKGKEFIKIQFDFPVNEEITFLQRTIYINPETFLPEIIEGKAKYMEIQDEWSLLEISYEETSSEQIQWNWNPKFDEFRTEYPLMTIAKTTSSLPNGTSIPGINVTDLTGKEKAFEFREDKLVLLDFWHVGCAPCLKAMPELEKLFQYYKNQGLEIIGLNPFDLEKPEKVIAFKERLKINYPLWFISNEIQQDFSVQIFPTLYLIKDGKVVYSKIGYKEGDYQLLNDQIKNQLK